jgi:hypothetical protein
MSFFAFQSIGMQKMTSFLLTNFAAHHGKALIQFFELCNSPQIIEGQINKRKQYHFLHSIVLECKKWYCFRLPASFAPRRGKRQIKVAVNCNT